RGSPIGSRYHKSAGICAAHEKWGLGFVEVYLPQVLLVALLSLAEVGCLIWNNLYSMSNDSRTSKDVAVSGNENAYNSFLPRDTTLDELIASGSRFVTAVDLWALSLLTHRLIRKLELVDPRRYPGLDQAVHATVLLLKSPQAQAAIDPLPRHLAEVGFAAHYFLKESDRTKRPRSVSPTILLSSNRFLPVIDLRLITLFISHSKTHALDFLPNRTRFASNWSWECGSSVGA